MRDQYPFVLALVTALCWGAAPIFGKLGVAKADPLAGLTFRTTVVAALLLPTLLLSGKLGDLTRLTHPQMLCLAAEGVLASLIGHFAYYFALKLGNPASITPIAAAFPLVTVALLWGSRLQHVNWGHGLGAALIIAGVLVMKLWADKA